MHRRSVREVHLQAGRLDLAEVLVGLPYISPTSRLHLAYISPISRLDLAEVLVGLAVVPRDRALLRLRDRARRALLARVRDRLGLGLRLRLRLRVRVSARRASKYLKTATPYTSPYLPRACLEVLEDG